MGSCRRSSCDEMMATATPAEAGLPILLTELHPDRIQPVDGLADLGQSRASGPTLQRAGLPVNSG